MSSALLGSALVAQLLVGATSHPTAALILPADAASEPQSVRLEAYADEALQAFASLKVLKAEELFGLPADPDAKAALDRGEAAYRQGLNAYDLHRYDEAERHLAQSVKDFGRAAAAMRDCGHLCDALGIYASTLERRGAMDEARSVLLDLFSLKPSVELTGPRFSKPFLKLKASVAFSPQATERGAALLRTKPQGARLYVDGEFAGYSPVLLPPLAAGKHLLRVQSPGFKQQGRFFEVTPEDTQVDLELAATPAFKTLLAARAELAADVLHGDGKASAGVGRRLGLERVLVASLRQDSRGVNEVVMSLVDVGAGRKLGTRRLTYREDETAGLKVEVERAVTALVNNAEASPEPVVKSQDPLAHHQGTEDWSSEDRGGRALEEEKAKKSKGHPRDPLESKSGMENW